MTIHGNWYYSFHFIYFLKIYLFIYYFLKYIYLFIIYLFILAVPGLSCGTWDLQLWHADYLAAARKLLVAACMQDRVP